MSMAFSVHSSYLHHTYNILSFGVNAMLISLVLALNELLLKENGRKLIE